MVITKGIIKLSDVKRIDVSNIPAFKSNISQLDKALGGFRMGELTIFTGKAGEGKSTIASQMLIEAVDQGFGVCAYSGELRADTFQGWAHRQMAGKKFVTEYHNKLSNDTDYFVNDYMGSILKRWYSDKFYIFDNEMKDVNAEHINILKVFNECYENEGCRVFLIDNLMTVKNVFKGSVERDYYRAQAEFVSNVLKFVDKTNTHVILVAHPRKTDNAIKGDDVSGASEIINLCHNLIVIKKEEDNADISTSISLRKNRIKGKLINDIGLTFDESSKRFSHWMNAGGFEKTYGWSDYMQVVQEKIESPF